MEGITRLMRSLNVGDQIAVTGLKRNDLFKIAKRIGIKITTIKYIGGFYVGRMPGDVESIQIEKTTNVSHPTKQTLVSNAESKGISDTDAEPVHDLTSNPDAVHDLTYESNNNSFDYAE